MADVGSAAGEASHASSSEAPQGYVPRVSVLRQDTVSSNGSDGYIPLPVGKWRLKLHGTCPKCRHQHTAVDIKVNVVSGASQANRVKCKNCKKKWLYFGGSNSTQISLLSTKTINPDPVEEEVRLTLIKMIRTATSIPTAIALAGIPESSSTNVSGEPFTSTGGPGLTPGSQPSVTFGETTAQISAHSGQNGVPTPALATPPPSSTGRAKDTGRSSFSISKLKLKLKPKVTVHFPGMKNFKLRKLFNIPNSKTTRPSAKSLGKLPVDSQLPESPLVQESAAADPNSAQAADSMAHEGRPGHHIVEPNPVDPQAPNPSFQHPEVAHFFATLKNDMLELMDKKERVDWARQRFTQFKTHRASSTGSNDTSMVYNRTHFAPFELLTGPHMQPQPRRDLGFFGTSSDLGLVDGLDRRSHTHAASSDERISESSTAVASSNAAPNQRFSGFRSDQDRRRHGSPCSPPVNNLPLALQQSRHPRGDARVSIDSNATGGVGWSASPNRGRLNRLSRGSMARASALGLNEMSLSRTSLHPRMEEEDTANSVHENSPSPPPERLSDNRLTST